MTWTPNPNPKAPDFEPGNTMSLRHGAYSERQIEAKAQEVRSHLLDLAPWLDHDEFAPAVARFLRAEARELLLHDWIGQVVEDKGVQAVPLRAWETATACANAAMKLSSLLGLDPTSYATLRAVTGQAQSTEAHLVDRLATAAKNRSQQTTNVDASTPLAIDATGSISDGDEQ